MKIGDQEYIEVRNAFMKEEYRKEPQKPSGMIGTWGWYLMKEREFHAKLRAEGKLDEDV